MSIGTDAREHRCQLDATVMADPDGIAGRSDAAPRTRGWPDRRAAGRGLVSSLLAGVLALTVIASSPAAVFAGPQGSDGVSESGAGSGADLAWQGCHDDVSAETGVAYECATLPVPLDHDRPAGRSIGIALVRVRATDPARRLGSLLVNPGGPGVSGGDFVLGVAPFIGELWGPEVPARFDLVGFDPRDVGRSAPLRCFATMDDAMASIPDSPFPVGFRELPSRRRALRALWQGCRHRGGPVADHMSTANVARDMDLTRAALGDDGLTYVGGSYGSYLGVTYANLYPDRVRSVVIDGILDPVRWANVEGRVPFSTALRSDEGAQATLDHVLALCEDAGPTGCALAPDASHRFDDLVARVRRHPVEFVDLFGEPLLITWPVLIDLTLRALYDPFLAPDATQWAEGLEAAAARTSPDPAVRAGLVDLPTGYTEAEYRNDVEAMPGVACVDSSNPHTLTRWWSAGVTADRRYGHFGRLWTWRSEACAGWPARDRDRYVGPWNAATTQPVLVIGNRWDPATPYAGAQTVRDLLPNSALLTLEMPAHTALGLSPCVDQKVAAYLLDPTTATGVDGTVCPASFNPFEPEPPSTAAQSAPTNATTRREATADVPAQVRRLLTSSAGGA